MNRNLSTGTCRYRRHSKVATVGTALGILAAGITFSGAASAQAQSSAPTEPRRFYVPCDVDRAKLPHTADAAEHWLSGCYRVSSDGTDREVRALMHRR
jgi:hypothetical protein